MGRFQVLHKNVDPLWCRAIAGNPFRSKIRNEMTLNLQAGIHVGKQKADWRLRQIQRYKHRTLLIISEN